MSESKGPKRNTVAIAIGVIIIVIIAGVALYFVFNALGVGKPSDVVVSGTVTTTGLGTSPQLVTFTSQSTGNPYVANANGGTYSITLPNRDTYSVTITYKVLGLTLGSTASAGTLNLDTTQSSITENWVG